MKTIFSFLFLLITSPLLAQPVPKYDLGFNGGVILQSATGADRAAGGTVGILYSVDAYRQNFFTKPVYSLFVQPDSTISENSTSVFGVLTVSSMIDANWQISGSVGQYSGTSTSSFATSVNLGEIKGTDTVFSNERPSGQIVSKLGGWILELGARYHFGTDIHPYVGAGLRYNTQAVTESKLTLNGTSRTILFYENVDEFGGYIGAGLKIPLSKVFCIDVQADAIFRNAKIGDQDPDGGFSNAWAVEPVLRAGISFDLNSVFDLGKHPGDYEEEENPKAKTKPKTPKAPGPTEK